MNKQQLIETANKQLQTLPDDIIGTSIVIVVRDVNRPMYHGAFDSDRDKKDEYQKIAANVLDFGTRQGYIKKGLIGNVN